VLAAFEGDVEAALWLGLATLFIDGTDGMLARRFRVKETIPWFDGARLDDIVDYLTYVFAPIVLLWTTGYLPDGALGWVVAALPLLASCYQFCRVDAKTSDHFFLGFPSYWNVVAFYAIVLDLSPAALAVIVVVCTVLVFVPVRYVYPSRMTSLRGLTLALSAVWAVTYAVLLLQLPSPNPWVVALSLGYLVYYAALSGYLTLRSRSVQRSQGDR
jgi:phosphatidylcholine synthase